MAKANPANLEPQAPVVPEGRKPVIEYIGEGAEKVKFTINTNAVKYVVQADGLVMEYLG